MEEYSPNPAKSRRGDELPTPAEFRAHYDYDKSTGILTRKVSPARNPAHIGPVGKPSGKHGHLQFRHGGRYYYVHRVAFLIVSGRWPAAEVDHRDGDVTNNAWANLREATKSQNARNRTIRTEGRSSTYIGVSLYKPSGKFRAYFSVGGKLKHLGYFESELDAFAAYLAAKAELHTYCPVPRDLVLGEVA